MSPLEYVRPSYEESLNELAEKLMHDRFVKSLGEAAIEQPTLFEEVEE